MLIKITNLKSPQKRKISHILLHGEGARRADEVRRFREVKKRNQKTNLAHHFFTITYQLNASAVKPEKRYYLNHKCRPGHISQNSKYNSEGKKEPECKEF
jgi:hypothetical protein